MDSVDATPVEWKGPSSSSVPGETTRASSCVGMHVSPMPCQLMTGTKVLLHLPLEEERALTTTTEKKGTLNALLEVCAAYWSEYP
mmetsp:Transcript_31796/g.43066  ORF Transcript_31796/g.43066 Transcript_31796/m.43066 type:complete len:85 (-) Transcript_31796:759-1013(-)